MLRRGVQPIDGERVQRRSTETDEQQTADSRQEPRGEAHHQGPDGQHREAGGDRGVAEVPHGGRQHETGEEHHHAEHSGQCCRLPAGGVTDLFQVGGSPHADSELGEHGIDDVQPRNEHVALAEVGKREGPLAR